MEVLLKITKHAQKQSIKLSPFTQNYTCTWTVMCLRLKVCNVMIVIGRDGGANPATAQSGEEHPAPSLMRLSKNKCLCFVKFLTFLIQKCLCRTFDRVRRSDLFKRTECLQTHGWDDRQTRALEAPSIININKTLILACVCVFVCVSECVLSEFVFFI